MKANPPLQFQNRRGFLHDLGLGATLFAVPGAFAEALLLTPRQTQGRTIQTICRWTPTTT